MSLVGLLAILVSIAVVPLAYNKITLRGLAAVLALLCFHVIACVYYYFYSTQEFADAWGYFHDPMNLHAQQFRVGTIATFKIVHFLRMQMNASYLDCFLLFQAIGFVGFIFLVRTFEEIEVKVGARENLAYFALLFLPSVNFWTVAIGKDAPLFLAISLAVWSLLNLRHRVLYFCLALGVMVLFRAHIALIATSALAAAAIFERWIGLGRKLALLAFALVGAALVIGPAQRAINFDPNSVSSIADYVDQQQRIYASAGGNTGVVHAGLPVRVLSLLFRPFFFDAHGFLGLIASIENLGFLLLVIYILAHWRNVAHLVARVFFVRFVLIFAAALLFSLALVYYNVGLGLRERVMAYPMFFSFIVALWTFRRTLAAPDIATMADVPQTPSRSEAVAGF